MQRPRRRDAQWLHGFGGGALEVTRVAKGSWRSEQRRCLKAMQADSSTASAGASPSSRELRANCKPAPSPSSLFLLWTGDMNLEQQASFLGRGRGGHRKQGHGLMALDGRCQPPKTRVELQQCPGEDHFASCRRWGRPLARQAALPWRFAARWLELRVGGHLAAQG